MSETNPAVADIFQDLNFKGDGSKPGGEEVPPEAAPPAPDMGATPPPEAAPPAPDMSTMPPPEAAPPAGAEAGAMLPPEAAPAPMAEGISRSLKERVMAKLIRARESGATLEDKVDFGHREMTLHDCMRECGINPMECGFGEAEMGGEEEHTGDPINDMLKSIAGFWNKEQKNFTIGGTRAKVKVIKDFKNGEFKNATPEHVKHVIALIDRMDPSSEHNQELGHIKHLAGTGHNPRAVEIEVGEGAEQDDFAKMMQQFQQMHPQADIGKMMQQIQNDPNAKITRSNTSSGTINGKPASYDDAMSKFKGMAGGMGFDASGDDPVGGMMKGIQGKMGGMMGKMPQMPQGQGMPGGMGNPQDMMKGMMGKFGMQESDELSNILKIAGVKK